MKECIFSFEAVFRLKIPEAVRFADENMELSEDGSIVNEGLLLSVIRSSYEDAVRDAFEGIELPKKLPTMVIAVTCLEDGDGGFGEFCITLNAEMKNPVLSNEPEELEGMIRDAILDAVELTAIRNGWTASITDIDEAA